MTPVRGSTGAHSCSNLPIALSGSGGIGLRASRRHLEDVAVRLLEPGLGAVRGLLAREPGAPRRRRAAAVAEGAVEDQEALDQPGLAAPERWKSRRRVRRGRTRGWRRSPSASYRGCRGRSRGCGSAGARCASGLEQRLPVVRARRRQSVAHRRTGPAERRVVKPLGRASSAPAGRSRRGSCRPRQPGRCHRGRRPGPGRPGPSRRG